MKKMLTNNLGLKLLSIVSAVMLWLIVVNIDDPVTYQDFSSIRVAMLNEDAVTDKDQVYRVEDNSDLINIRVWAKRSVLDKLSAEDFTATADMEKNIKFGNLVGIEVSCSNRNVRTADITKSRENVVISIEDAASELFNVVVKQSGQADDAYVVGTALPEQSLIEIRGPASVVARINRVQADLDITGFNSDRSEICALTILDNNGAMVDTTYLEYAGKTEGMNVKVTTLRKKDARLKPEYTGVPSGDYSFKNIFAKPETVKIAGTTADISKVSEIVIPAEEINIEGIEEDTQIVVDIAKYLPENIRLVNEADAMVTVVVELERKQGKSVKIPVSEIEVKNLSRGMKIDYGNLNEIEVVVKGTSAELEQLDENEVRVALDLEEYTRAGDYTGIAEVTLPEMYGLMEDVEIEFKLTRAAGGSAGNSNSNGD